MKPQNITIIFCLSTLISMVGVTIFVANNSNKDLARYIMVFGILLHLIWMGGLASWLLKKLSK